MSFTIICDKCNSKQIVRDMDMKEKTEISIEITNGWEGSAEITLQCSNCGNKISDDNEYRKIG